MYKFLTSKKGFTIVELMIVLVLLGLGVFAVANLIKVAYKSFDKSEERYLKQEAVKSVAEMLRSGSNSVSAAQTADVFATAEIVPTGEAIDDSYSYLFFEPHTDEETGEVDGYFLYIQNKEQKRADALQLSDVPMYVSIDAYIDYSYEGAPEKENQCGVIITLAALEDTYSYEDGDGDGQIDPPTSDDIYYSLDVAYHFPNMVTSDNGVTVNYIKKGIRSTADLYDTNGNFQKEGSGNKHVESVDVNGVCLRVYCDSIISGDNTNTNVAIPKLCFVATASYGADSGEVGMLCEFRDKVLLTNPLGQAFVKAYYTVSPPLADFIAEHEGLRATVRVMLKPLIIIAEYSLNEDIRGVGIGCLAVFMMCGFGISATLVKVNIRNKKARRKVKV